MNHHRLQTSTSQILKISFPIMLGSAAQNVLALVDSTFLYHYDEASFAAMGFIGVFYLVIAAMGFSISRGGQIWIARKMGEGSVLEVGRLFQTVFVVEGLVALLLFAIVKLFGPWIIGLFIDDPQLASLCNDYLQPRSYGIFFSYFGVALIALYTGIARTTFILVSTVILFSVNTVLDYLFVFGVGGAPELGIAGAGWASTIAEAAAFVSFIVYMIFDHKIKDFRITSILRFDPRMIWQILSTSNHLLWQTFFAMGSWVAFFGMVENMGQHALAISNLARMIYLVLSIPCWGLASGTNTIVSHFVGSRKRMAVKPLVWKIIWITLILTWILAIPVVFFPKVTLYPILGKSDMSLLVQAQPTFYMLLAILSLFSIGGIYFNGLLGTGATGLGLRMQVVATILYLIFIYVAIHFLQWPIYLVWSAELLYWGFLLGVSAYLLEKYRWTNYAPYQ